MDNIKISTFLNNSGEVSEELIDFMDIISSKKAYIQIVPSKPFQVVKNKSDFKVFVKTIRGIENLSKYIKYTRRVQYSNNNRFTDISQKPEDSANDFLHSIRFEASNKPVKAYELNYIYNKYFPKMRVSCVVKRDGNYVRGLIGSYEENKSKIIDSDDIYVRGIYRK